MRWDMGVEVFWKYGFVDQGQAEQQSGVGEAFGIVAG